MKLYRKKLVSVDALKREKLRLRYERRRTASSDLNPLHEMGGSKITASARTGIMGTVMELFSAKNNLQTALALGRPLLKMLGKRRARRNELREEWGAPKKKKSSFLRKLALEIAIGYVTGKALLMAIQAIRTVNKRQKTARLKAKMAM